MKIAYKILLLIILPISIISVLAIFFINSLLYNELEKRFIENLEKTTYSYANLVDARLDRVSDFAKITSRQYSANPNIINEDVILNNINDILTLDSIIYGSSVYLDTTYTGNLRNTIFYSHKVNDDIKTIILNSTDKEYDLIIGSNPSYISEPKKQMKGVWTSPYFDEGLSNAYMVTYSEPIISNNIVIGVVTLDLRLVDLQKMLDKNEKSIEGRYDPLLIILNRADSIVVYSDDVKAIGKNIYKYKADGEDNEDEVLNMDTLFTSDKGSGRMRNRYGVNRLYVSYSNIKNSNWIAVNVLDLNDVQEYINSTVYKTLIAIVIVLGALVLMVFYTSRLLTNPLRKLSQATINIANGSYKNLVLINSKDEIGTLATNFNLMAHEIDKRETQLFESNQSLEKAQYKLLSLDDAKNDFLKLISHEIRTPLNGIVGSTHFLKDMIVDPELKEFLEMLRESVDRLDNFSSLALEITEMQTVGQNAKKETFEINDVISNIVESNIDQIKEKQLIVKMNLMENLTLVSQRHYFNRAFEELFRNALKFSNNDTIIRIESKVDDGKVKIILTDTGEIIPQDKIEEIVKPFGLAKEHYDKNIGLGLAYIKQYLDLNNAIIEISSTNEETEFVLVFESN